MSRFKGDPTKGRIRPLGLLIHRLLLFLLQFDQFAFSQPNIPIIPSNSSRFSPSTSNFTFSSAYDRPFGQDNITVFKPASGLTITGNALCLTQPVTNKIDPQQDLNASGRCLYYEPVRVLDRTTKEALSFSTMFSFWISTVSLYDPGEGLAFVMAPDLASNGSFGGYLGWLNSSTNGKAGHNFAVEFDIVQNAEFGDPDRNHVGVNLNSLNSTCVKTGGYYADVDSGSFTTLNLSSSEEKLIYAWISYNGSKQELNVSISPSKARPMRPLLTCSVNLTDILREFMYVGFTASTGSDDTAVVHNAQHSVYDWSFRSDGLAFDIFGGGWMGNNGTHPSRNKVKNVLIIFSITSAPLIILLLCVVAFYMKKSSANTKKFQVNELELLNYGPKKFSYRELSAATKTFSDSQVLGEGAFGCVYKGILSRKSSTQSGPSGALAVKRISKTSSQGAQEFEAEVKVIGRARHRNLVPLLGWCHERGDLLLVYEFMPNGSLDQLLFNKTEVLTWERRVKIVRGVGSALAFLHEEWEQRVVHRDVKASNVMLDADFNARLGDFGLARSCDHSLEAPKSTVLQGTPGFIAPELWHNGKATAKTDVYSFGALSLEIATGRRAHNPPSGTTLVDWVWKLFREDRLLDAADVRLENAFDSHEMTILLQVGLLCSHSDPGMRPTMRTTLAMLKEEVALPSMPLSNPLERFPFSLARTGLELLMDDEMGGTGETDSDFQQVTNVP